ncbi:hypothetical protein QTP88_009854 [Uroleucon formosanum]
MDIHHQQDVHSDRERRGKDANILVKASVHCAREDIFESQKGKEKLAFKKYMYTKRV